MNKRLIEHPCKTMRTNAVQLLSWLLLSWLERQQHKQQQEEQQQQLVQQLVMHASTSPAARIPLTTILTSMEA
jgi:hypothetical protein